MKETNLYGRQALIPTWSQGKLSDLSIALVGVGGLGACVLEALLMMGIGEDGTTVLVDPDEIALSNLARLPYAALGDVGKPKVLVARGWVESLRPGRRVRAVQLDLLDERAQREVVACDIVIGATDSELARRALLHLAREFMRPLLDGGSGVRVDRFGEQLVCAAGGQVRLYVPGTTPCLMCALGIDQHRVSAELARRRARADPGIERVLRNSGYLQGNAIESLPEPSVYFVNSVVAGVLVSTLTQYVLEGIDENFAGVAVDLATPALNRLTAEHGELCPFCGESAIIGGGTFFNEGPDLDAAPPEVNHASATPVAGATLLGPPTSDKETP